MESIAVPARVAQFLTTIRARTDTEADFRLRQSIETWLSYYRYLRMTVERSYSPVLVEFMEKSFYPFTRAVLSHLTVTFCAFFGLPWQRAEMTHTHLTHAFALMYTLNMLQGDTITLYTAMRTLHDRVVTDQRDEHASPSLEDFSAVLTLLNQYIAAMLRFFEQNIEHSLFQSIMGSDAHTEEP